MQFWPEIQPNCTFCNFCISLSFYLFFLFILTFLELFQLYYWIWEKKLLAKTFFCYHWLNWLVPLNSLCKKTEILLPFSILECHAQNNPELLSIFAESTLTILFGIWCDQFNTTYWWFWWKQPGLFHMQRFEKTFLGSGQSGIVIKYLTKFEFIYYHRPGNKNFCQGICKIEIIGKRKICCMWNNEQDFDNSDESFFHGMFFDTKLKHPIERVYFPQCFGNKCFLS